MSNSTERTCAKVEADIYISLSIYIQSYVSVQNHKKNVTFAGFSSVELYCFSDVDSGAHQGLRQFMEERGLEENKMFSRWT